jgi:hypothetical protein
MMQAVIQTMDQTEAMAQTVTYLAQPTMTAEMEKEVTDLLLEIIHPLVAPLPEQRLHLQAKANLLLS